MTLQEIFDRLLTEPVTVTLSRNQAESMRVMLSKKFSKYKEFMNDMGYLDASMASSALRLVYDADKGSAIFSLVAKKRVRDYTIISHETSNPA